MKSGSLSSANSEQERLANIKRNQQLLQDLDLIGHTPSSSRRPIAPSRTARAKAKPAKKTEPERIQPRRTSNRLAGVEADSEALKRKYEVGGRECRARGAQHSRGQS